MFVFIIYLLGNLERGYYKKPKPLGEIEFLDCARPVQHASLQRRSGYDLYATCCYTAN